MGLVELYCFRVGLYYFDSRIDCSDCRIDCSNCRIDLSDSRIDCTLCRLVLFISMIVYNVLLIGCFGRMRLINFSRIFVNESRVRGTARGRVRGRLCVLR